MLVYSPLSVARSVSFFLFQAAPAATAIVVVMAFKLVLLFGYHLWGRGSKSWRGASDTHYVIYMCMRESVSVSVYINILQF